MILKKTLSFIQRRFFADYEVSSTIRHRGEKGRQREHGLINLLREHLPMAYGVATGEIVSYKSETSSPQCDIIIYDQLHYPILGKNDVVQIVPLESVFAVIEVRSILDVTTLRDASNKFNAIIKMPRSKPKSRRKKDMMSGPLCVIFGFKLQTTRENITSYQYNAPYGSVVAALDTAVCFCMGDGKDKRYVLVPTADEENGQYETLAWFYFLLLEEMRQIDLGVPDFSRIFSLMGVN